MSNKCTIKFGKAFSNDYRKTVCQDLPVQYVHDGHYYCVLHYPDNNKHEDTNFNEILEKRLKKQDNNFQSVYFPLCKVFEGKTIKSDINFNSATFSDEANFYNTTFDGNAVFINSVFEWGANFNLAVFNQAAYFSNSIFNKGCHFGKTKFVGEFFCSSVVFDTACLFSYTKFFHRAHFTDSKFCKNVTFFKAEFNLTIFEKVRFEGDVNLFNVIFFGQPQFSNAVFSREVLFHSVTFKDNVFFNKVKIEKESRIIFRLAVFDNSVCSFYEAYISGYLIFVGGTRRKINSSPNLLESEDTGFLKEKAHLDLQNTYIDSPEHISFHTFRLQPSWFINANSSKFLFTNCVWKTFEGNDISVDSELSSLCDRRILAKDKLILEVFRHLVTNCENNSRFEEASSFRRMAFETEWLEKKEKVSNWIKNLVPESEKLKRRFGGSTDEEDNPNPPTNSFGILRRSGDLIIHGLYRITSFYGESWSWAAFVLVFIIFAIFPFIYTQTEFQVTPKTIPLEVVVKDCPDVTDELKPVCKIENRGLNFWNGEAIAHSLSTATLQTVEYRIPISKWGSFWVILEKIFAPLQVALLALAIRRKFMR